MKLKELMTTHVQTIEPEATLQEAAEEMRNWDVGALPVCDKANTAIGFITDRDIVVRAIAKGLDPVKTQVKEVMSAEVLSCPASYDLERAVGIMKEKRVRRMIVTDTNNSPIGMISLGDLALHCDKKDLSEKVLEEVSRPGTGKPAYFSGF
ncbi:MAG TPA: CBS domain-containing protein [Verrucomicrobiae bacterium]|jgi:CBS domain-containing protein|nr:CBS domain-containing protein [Verrucomicrobiae bacterium]